MRLVGIAGAAAATAMASNLVWPEDHAVPSPKYVCTLVYEARFFLARSARLGMRSTVCTSCATWANTAAEYPVQLPTSSTTLKGESSKACIISATMYGWEMVCPAPMYNGPSSYALGLSSLGRKSSRGTAFMASTTVRLWMPLSTSCLSTIWRRCTAKDMRKVCVVFLRFFPLLLVGHTQMSKFARVGKAPADFYVVEPTLNALEDELKRCMQTTVQGNKRGESLWPIHQIDWQRTRYVHDMYYKFNRIDKATYDYCVRNRLINGPLSAKWLDLGYEKLCSLHAIDSRNFSFGGVSICRTPKSKLGDRKEDDGGEPTRYIFNGCLGCGSGQAGVENIFGNKYGQRLAEVQIKREADGEQAAAAAVAETEEEPKATKKKKKRSKDEGEASNKKKKSKKQPEEI
ncbi:hypothetical protein BASA81_012698 [Batrachochytrium salamandrivorans]|nr:hypothetical protein BASA81_012698 [Batrachochytrium salamandrivorans]